MEKPLRVDEIIEQTTQTWRSRHQSGDLYVLTPVINAAGYVAGTGLADYYVLKLIKPIKALALMAHHTDNTDAESTTAFDIGLQYDHFPNLFNLWLKENITVADAYETLNEALGFILPIGEYRIYFLADNTHRLYIDLLVEVL